MDSGIRARALVAAFAAAAAAGCGAAGAECEPQCRSGYECFHGLCVPAGEDVTGDGADATEDRLDSPDRADDGSVPPDVRVCAPGDTRCSAGGEIERCRGDGSGWDATPCRFGCGPDPVPHCLEWEISNIPDRSLLSAGAPPGDPIDLPVDDDYLLVFDTNTGAVTLFTSWGDEVEGIRPADMPGLHEPSGIHFRVLAQPGGAPDLAVFSLWRLDVPPNIVLTAWGSRALVLLSDDDARIEGGVFAGCHGGDAPPIAGGREGDTGPGAGGAGTSAPPDAGGTRDGGGGGGAFGGSGGLGGGYEPPMRGTGGATYGNADLVPLDSGSGGGRGAGSGAGRRGGASGGAVQIVSGGAIRIHGWVDAGGCGGLSTYLGSREGGGGGGSGGGVLLEAPVVVVSGAISANGGGGGAGGEGAPDGRSDGSNGLAGSGDPAPGGVTVSRFACSGGNGSSARSPAGGDAPTCDGGRDLYNAGGGGGGSGRIRINALERSIAGLASPALDTPAATQGTLNLR
ncbi:MAG: hypothetical protein QME96_15635 [Myxococcota bacterium]|nr:hypothetical protein [Myxococcota bacterium]